MDKPKEKDVPLTIRLPEELKIALQRQANANGRRINAEICIRLRESLKTSFTPGASYSPELAVLPSRYGPAPAATEVTAREEGAPYTFDELDRAMLEVFRAMPVQKKLALLSLLQ